MLAHATNMEQSVKQELERRYPDCSVKFMKVQKNNGLKRNGVTILAPGRNIAPTVYIDEYLASGCPVDKICDEVSRVYEENKDSITLETDFSDFQTVCGRICFQLVNAERNREWLQMVPHRRLFDLAVVYYILLDDSSSGMATVKVTNQLASCWGVDEERLYAYAAENTRNLLHFVVTPMEMVIAGRQADEEPLPPDYEVIAEKDFIMTIQKDTDWNLYVVSNKDKTFGAVSMLYTDILCKISERLKANLFILPSSTHEVIMIPEDKAMDSSELFQIVCAVNRNDVCEEEFLADNVYYYNREENTVASIY